MARNCWFVGRIEGIGHCEGRTDRAHLIRAQTIRREVGVEHIWDPRVWVESCRRHHSMLDHSRQIRVPRGMLPPSVEAAAAEWGLTWWLERTYGGGPWEVEAA